MKGLFKCAGARNKKAISTGKLAKDFPLLMEIKCIYVFLDVIIVLLCMGVLQQGKVEEQ